MNLTNNEIVLLILAFLALVGIATYFLIRNLRKGYVAAPGYYGHFPHPEPSPRPRKGEVMREVPNKHPLGWVYVSQAELLSLNPEGIGESSVDTSPLSLKTFFCAMRYSDIFDVVLLQAAPAHAHADWSAITGGLTIGSALFNYPIPPSFVQLDVETAMFCQMFMVNQTLKRTVKGWIDSDETYKGWLYTAISDVEVALQLKESEAIHFFHTHRQFITNQFGEQTRGGLFPNRDAFVRNVLVRLELNPNDEKTLSYFYITLILILDIGEMTFPSSWMFTSKMTKAVKNLILWPGEDAQPTPPNKPSPLTLVVNK
jgi:hypothetical protein